MDYKKIIGIAVFSSLVGLGSVVGSKCIKEKITGNYNKNVYQNSEISNQYKKSQTQTELTKVYTLGMP